MKLLGYFKSLLAIMAVTIILFVIVSGLDLVTSVLYSRYYTSTAFVVSFGVGGIFSAVFSYFYGIRFAPEKNERARWTIIVLLLLIGCFLFFFLSRIEGGEYEAAIKAFGATMGLGSLLFVIGKIDLQ